MERKQAPPEDLSFPKPWEDRVSKARWQHHRERLMSKCCGGRPNEWWLYERNMQPPRPRRQARVLYEMGELSGGELQQCLIWFRMFYDDANTADERTAYWQWDDIPPSLIKQWDRERE